MLEECFVDDAGRASDLWEVCRGCSNGGSSMVLPLVGFRSECVGDGGDRRRVRQMTVTFGRRLIVARRLLR